MPTSINENASVSEKAFVIFPNPTSGVLNFSEPLQYIEVLDVYGQLLLKKNEKTSEILVGNYKDGIYFIKSNKGLTKFIINH
jgi:hypothetical protein